MYIRTIVVFLIRFYETHCQLEILALSSLFLWLSNYLFSELNQIFLPDWTLLIGNISDRATLFSLIIDFITIPSLRWITQRLLLLLIIWLSWWRLNGDFAFCLRWWLYRWFLRRILNLDRYLRAWVESFSQLSVFQGWQLVYDRCFYFLGVHFEVTHHAFAQRLLLILSGLTSFLYHLWMHLDLGTWRWRSLIPKRV